MSSISRRFAHFIRFPLFFLFLSSPLWSQETVSAEIIESLEQWRWGVIAYNDGAPGKSLLALERAVALNPTEPRIREWLGRAYWRSGLEDAALGTWERLSEEGEASTALLHRIERLRRRLEGGEDLAIEDQWIPLTALQGTEGENRFFERPSAVRPLADGTGAMAVVSYASGEVALMDANGNLEERFDGGIEAFDRPFDILPLPDGRLLVSEFQADRISVLSAEKYRRGYRVETWGTTGRGAGEFLGPQYLALSSDGLFVYISDWGNRRVTKWDLQGNEILRIDENTAGFAGFGRPTGIAVGDELLYIADALTGTVQVFDDNGNYRGLLRDEGITSPEGLLLDRKRENLLVADGATVLSIRLDNGTLETFSADFGGGRRRFTTLDWDENGNLAISDFDGDEVILLAPLASLYAGLEVTLDQVRADTFPDMAVDVRVQDRDGNPVIGLDIDNFIVIDGGRRMPNAEIVFTGSTHRELDIVAVIDSSGGSADMEGLGRGIRDLETALVEGDGLSLISAGPQAAVVAEGAPGVLESLEALAQIPPAGSARWDYALRLAGTSLAPGRVRKAVVAFVSSSVSPASFDEYGLRETARFLANNDISFFPIYLETGSRSPELDYIAAETGGSAYDLYRPEGTGALAAELRRRPSGRYTLAWRSVAPTDFGRAFLPISVEIIFISKSGRDDSGAFAPMR